MIGRRFTSERIRKERREQFFVLVLAWVAMFVVVVLLFSQIAHLRVLRVTNISISGNKNVATEEIVPFILEALSGSHWWLFPKQNVFFVRTSVLEDTLYTEFPRFKRVKIDRTSFNALRVLIEEREPFAFWCSASDTCYFIDENGFVYAPAVQFLKNTSFVRYAEGAVDTEHPIGSSFMDNESFAALKVFLQDLKSRLSLRSARVSQEGERVVVSVAPPDSNSTFSIFVTATTSYQTALSDLDTIIASSDFREAVPSLSDLDYIDLRFGNKVFYTTKNSVE